jgi:hypothetical protein
MNFVISLPMQASPARGLAGGRPIIGRWLPNQCSTPVNAQPLRVIGAASDSVFSSNLLAILLHQILLHQIGFASKPGLVKPIVVTPWRRRHDLVEGLVLC